MSQQARGWRRPMRPRDRHEQHRAATPLELLYDLCFVVAIAQVAARLHHGVLENHVGQALLGFVMVFFAIWWAWMNFTWFASAYDVDDAPYRMTTFLQIAGVLVLAAGVPRAFDRGDFSAITIGYVMMRIGLVAQWLRAAAGHLACRTTALRYAAGVAVLQLGWIGLLFLPLALNLPAFGLLVLLELGIPLWAERSGETPWHPHHIAERYGLMTLIVLGESVLAATLAVQGSLDGGQSYLSLIALAAGALLTLFGMWWLYFDEPAADLLTGNSVSFAWGYGHYFVFASAAGVGAGLAVAVDHAAGHGHASRLSSSLAVAVPVAIYLLAVWTAHIRPRRRGAFVDGAFLLGALLVLAAAWSPWPVVVIGGVIAALVAVTTVRR